MALVTDSFSFATLDSGPSVAGVRSVSATILLNPKDIFVAQVALTRVATGSIGSATAFISGFTQLNGNFVQLPGSPTAIEWFDAQSVTFVLSLGQFSSASALASVTNYSAT
jgi:hypothetical protein